MDLTLQNNPWRESAFAYPRNKRCVHSIAGVPGLLASVALSIIIDRLDPSVGGTGPHGLTVRAVPHVLRRNASIAARTTNRDDRETPLRWAGCAH